MKRALIALALVAATAAAGQADVVVGNFEGSLTEPGMGTWSGPGTASFSSTGATLGSSSAGFVVPTGFNWSIALNGNEPLRDAILANDKIAFDVTVPTGPQTPGLWEYLVFAASFNSATTGWQQSGGNLVRADGGGENAWNVDKATFIWDYPSAIVNAASPWSQFNIGTNLGNLGAGSPPTLYIDNVRLIPVPEPTAITALAGLAAAGLRRRR